MQHLTDCFFVGGLTYFDSADLADWNRRTVEAELVKALMAFSGFEIRESANDDDTANAGCNITNGDIRRAQQAIGDLEK